MEPELEGCNENLVRTRPDAVRKLHQNFLEVGADIIETNSFGSTSVVLAEYGLQADARELNRLAAAIAREAADAAGTPNKPRFVAGSMGPTTKTISVTGGITFDILCAAYQEQAEGLIEGGADLLLLETVQDTLNAKAGLVGIERAIEKLGIAVAVAVSGTIETMGTLLAGQDIEAFYASLAHRDLLWIGLNCATGPDFMTDHLRTLAEISRFNVAVVPNAGLPDEDGRYNETPEMLAQKIGRFVEQGWINLVGGCCGTTPEHIRLLARMVEGVKPRRPSTLRRSIVSGIEALVIDDNTRPVIVGERTNVLGSRKFKRQIAEGKIRGGRRGRTRAGTSGRPRARRMPAGPRPRRKRRRHPLHRNVGQEGEGAADDRLDRPSGDRRGAQTDPGQIANQFDQPRRRRGALPQDSAAGAPLRCGAGGRLYRR